jgi:hypothetical protein
MKELSAEVLESLGFEIKTINKANYEVEAVSKTFDVVKHKNEECFSVYFNRGDYYEMIFEGYEYEHQIESLMSALYPQPNKRQKEFLTTK